MMLRDADLHVIHFIRRCYEPASRLALFIVFFWFGALKVFGLSPADGMVEELLLATLPSFMLPSTFLLLFGLFEMLIGAMFLIKGVEREVIPLLAVHLFATFMPLIILPELTWTAPFVPTMEGQYIIKNLAIIAAAMGVAAHLHPLRKR